MVKRLILLLLVCGLCLSQLGPVSSVSAGASWAVVATDSKGKLIDGVPVSNISLNLTSASQFAQPTLQYVALTDGYGDGDPGTCVVFGASSRLRANGLLVPGDPLDPNNGFGTTCLTGSAGIFNIGSGQILVPTAGVPAGATDGIIQGNQLAPSVHVSGLFACSSSTINRIATVDDALSPTYLGTVTGGGAVQCPVYCNGTNWVAH